MYRPEKDKIEYARSTRSGFKKRTLPPNTLGFIIFKS